MSTLPLQLRATRFCGKTAFCVCEGFHQPRTAARSNLPSDDASTRHQLAELAEKIRRSLVSDPDDFAFREPMYMERDQLHHQLKGTR